MTKRVLILAANGFEQSELLDPKSALEAEGFETIVAGIKPGKIRGWSDHDWGESVTVDALIEDVEAEDFDALLIPGGQMNPDILRLQPRAIELVEDFDDAEKPIAAICHGPWLLVEADIVDGRRVTGWPSIRTDLENAGAEVFDEQVVVDGHIITSRMPGDIPAFNEALIAAINEAGDKVEDYAQAEEG